MVERSPGPRHQHGEDIAPEGIGAQQTRGERRLQPQRHMDAGRALGRPEPGEEGDQDEGAGDGAAGTSAGGQRRAARRAAKGGAAA